ncbi:MAG: hypothetical protein ABSG68_23775 [Thermoguttaceae bacterium]|jgi:malate dehydrogenase (oxaloacetate-decarboxylating)
MRLAPAIAIIVIDDELPPDYIVPSVFDRRVAPAVAKAVAAAAVETAVTRRQ